jgi:hypothetical protein
MPPKILVLRRALGKSVELFGLDVLTAVTMRNTIFWVVMPCSSELARRVRGIHRHHHQMRGGAQHAYCSSETSDPLRNTRRYDPEDRIFHLPAVQILLKQEVGSFATQLFFYCLL